ncbi:MAG TPA: SusD/RagB family nutrient-binding outer membrane lipoprotein, partial [Ramlibacter sp.]|nr:SusD/RagB family nutrient-binding outer membrane lipoprotein [Ramlibacter sp.]
PGAGPGQVDLWYGGDAAKWMQLAHTLKARFYLHTAEQDPSSYAKALAEAQQGISTPANDLRSYQSSATTESNMWYQFQIVQRAGYLAMGARLVNLMAARNDPRLSDYFSLDGDGQYGGADPGQGDDPNTQSNLSAARLDAAYRQPLVTHAENQLIIAESAYRTGDQTTALDSLNAERTSAGLSALAGITGAALLDSIMTEKYVALFQNIETWNDYKRECTPALTPAGSAAHVIARPYYGTSEANTNPNFPGEPASGRNWNDPNPCP